MNKGWNLKKRIEDDFKIPLNKFFWEADVLNFVEKLKIRLSFIMNNSNYTEEDLMSEIDRMLGYDAKQDLNEGDKQ